MCRRFRLQHTVGNIKTENSCQNLVPDRRTEFLRKTFKTNHHVVEFHVENLSKSSSHSLQQHTQLEEFCQIAAAVIVVVVLEKQSHSFHQSCVSLLFV